MSRQCATPVCVEAKCCWDWECCRSTVRTSCHPCRLQEQLLEAKAQLSKVSKDKEAQEALAARLEQQRNTLDGEVTQVGGSRGPQS